MGKFTEDNLKKGEKEPRDELGGLRSLTPFMTLT